MYEVVIGGRKSAGTERGSPKAKDGIPGQIFNVSLRNLKRCSLSQRYSINPQVGRVISKMDVIAN